LQPQIFAYLDADQHFYVCHFRPDGSSPSH
jgi:hypothetical protein